MEDKQIPTKRWPRIARPAGIWIFGLAAGACVGDVIGTAVKYGYENETGPGVLAGMCAFACFRLWAKETADPSE